MNEIREGTTAPAPDAELRLATLVKCDIVDSTLTWAGLDPSDALALSRGFRRTVEEVVSRHGGHVERWEGDGALIVFGYPHAREDAPETGVRAGMELAKAIRALQSGGRSLEFRVGVASGPIAVDLVSRALEGMVFNAAERIKTMAEPGHVVADDTTRSLARSFFAYQDLGQRPAKGYDGGLRAWRVLGETQIVSRFEAQRFDPARAQIVGRSEELAVLAHAWAQAAQGARQVVAIVGEAGMGKSRLVRAVRDRAGRDGAGLVEIDCMPSAGNSPMFPLGVWLRRAAGLDDPGAAERKPALARAFLSRWLPAGEVDEALASLAILFGLPQAASADGSPDVLRERTIATIVRLLCSHAARAPLAVLCEDLHWSDDTTARVVQRFAQESAALPVLLVATARSLARLQLRLDDGLGACREIVLAPLGADEAAELVRSVAHGAPLAGDLVADIVRRGEGVPLVLEEVTRGALDTSAVSPAQVPTSLQLVVESRLERWPQHRALVQAASVLGREFSLRLLQRIMPPAGGEVAGTVRQLVEQGLFAPMAEGGGERARFPHAMIRDAVYQTLLRDDRRAWHSRIADEMAAAAVDHAEGSVEELAQHLAEAARFDEAIEVRLAASAETAARGAYVETEGHCEAALKLLERLQAPARRGELEFKLLLQLGVALTGRHGYAAPQVEATYRRAREVCGETAQAEALYPILRGLAAFNLVGGKLGPGYELSLQAMELAERSGRAAFRIDAMSVHCYATLYYRTLEECRSWILRCLALYREEGGENLRYPVPNDAGTAAIAILPTVEWLLGDPAAAEAAIRDGLRHVDRPNHDFDKAYMHAWIAGVRFTQRRFGESRQAAQDALAIGQRHGFREWIVTGFLLERLAQASMEPSPAALQEAFDTCTALAAEGVGLNASWYLWALARGYRVAGQDAVAAQLIAQAFLRAEASGETRMEAELLVAQAEIEADPAAAARLLRKALDVAHAQGNVANGLRAAAALVLRSDTDAAGQRLAAETLDLLEGRRDSPAQAGWMAERLAALRARAAA